MTDREKVIKGLAACIPETEEDAKLGCSNCPYECCKADAVRLPIQMIEDIRAVLKRQEARLLTYDDFHSGREDGGEAIPCWKEARSKTRRSGWAVIVYGKMLADWETGVARYWTARPTEEQMQEEAWPGT
jgi:hypothetical protein